MDSDYGRLAQLVRQAIEARGWNQRTFIRESDISRSTVQRLWRGEHVGPRTVRVIERVLGWERGSADRILIGGEPTPLSESHDTSADPQAPETPTARDVGRALPVRARQIIENGQVYDFDVIRFEGLDMLFVAVAGETEPEELREELLRRDEIWEAVRKAVAGVQARYPKAGDESNK